MFAFFHADVSSNNNKMIKKYAYLLSIITY